MKVGYEVAKKVVEELKQRIKRYGVKFTEKDENTIVKAIAETEIGTNGVSTNIGRAENIFVLIEVRDREGKLRIVLVRAFLRGLPTVIKSGYKDKQISVESYSFGRNYEFSAEQWEKMIRILRVLAKEDRALDIKEIKERLNLKGKSIMAELSWLYEFKLIELHEAVGKPYPIIRGFWEANEWGKALIEWMEGEQK